MIFRGRGKKRCRAEGLERFEVFVGVVALANNLMLLAGVRESTIHCASSPPPTTPRAELGEVEKNT